MIITELSKKSDNIITFMGFDVKRKGEEMVIENGIDENKKVWLP